MNDFPTVLGPLVCHHLPTRQDLYSLSLCSKRWNNLVHRYLFQVYEKYWNIKSEPRRTANLLLKGPVDAVCLRTWWSLSLRNAKPRALANALRYSKKVQWWKNGDKLIPSTRFFVALKRLEHDSLLCRLAVATYARNNSQFHVTVPSAKGHFPNIEGYIGEYLSWVDDSVSICLDWSTAGEWNGGKKPRFTGAMVKSVHAVLNALCKLKPSVKSVTLDWQYLYLGRNGNLSRHQQSLLSRQFLGFLQNTSVEKIRIHRRLIWACDKILTDNVIKETAKKNFHLQQVVVWHMGGPFPFMNYHESNLLQ